MKTCVIIPTYNEAAHIAPLVRKIRTQGLDVTVIDDGSSDATADLARREGALVIKNASNMGKGACLIRGFEHALQHDYEAVITMDGDGQHLPEEIPLFLAQASAEGSLIIGNRMSNRMNMPWPRVLTNKFMSWLISSIAGQEIPDTQCGFRLIKRPVLDEVLLTTNKYETESEIIIKSARKGFAIVSVPIKSVYMNSKSGINPFVDTMRFFRFILSLDPSREQSKN